MIATIALLICRVGGAKDFYATTLKIPQDREVDLLEKESLRVQFRPHFHYAHLEQINQLSSE